MPATTTRETDQERDSADVWTYLLLRHATNYSRTARRAEDAIESFGADELTRQNIREAIWDYRDAILKLALELRSTVLERARLIDQLLPGVDSAGDILWSADRGSIFRGLFEQAGSEDYTAEGDER